jgi:serine/threonine protein kinase/tetratricopeptide (TPR) repeat protein
MNDPPDIEVFLEAVRLPAGERGAYLDRACAVNGELRHRVEVLLLAHERAGDFLAEPPTGVPAAGGPAASEKASDRIGRYKLLSEIGEGGCGVVFMAEQEEPVRRRVALKIVKPGMDTKNVIARFEAERQALALMDHPNIAHVFDAGTTRSGRPYFVMELVRGVKITHYCDQNFLSTRARLELFIQVSEAVQHAHQKGIIHRDLKPSNILVTTSAAGQPLLKVIDFGIAKATTGQRLTDKTVFTAFELLIGTPAYMSPEQAALTSVDVDTRTDIYSLGVLLYELLTGATPFDTRELLKAGLDEVRRAIRNQEPPRPSSKLRTMVAAELMAVSVHRHAEPPKLIRDLRGDLDWIVMKALEKDRSRRYATANGLAMDIRRYLADEPIVARPPNAAYKLRKLVLRNRLWFATASIVLVSLVVGLSVTSWSLARETRARHESDQSRKRADIESTQSREVTRFLKDMLAGIQPSVAHGRDTTMLQEILEKAEQRVGRELTNEPAVQAELWTTIGGVWDQLKLRDKAEPMLRNALETRRNLLGNDHSLVAESLLNLAQVLVGEAKSAEAETLCREALAIRRKLFGEESPEAVAALNVLATTVYTQKNRLPEAESLERQVVAERRKLLGEKNPELARSLMILGNILDNEGKLSEAEAADREGLAIYRKSLGEDDLAVTRISGNLALVLRGEGKLEEAETMQRQVLAGLRKWLPEFHEDVTIAVVNLIEILRLENKRDKVDPLLHPLLQIDLGAHPEAAHQLYLRASILARHEFWQEAIADASKLREVRPQDHDAYHILAPVLIECGDGKDYRELRQQIIAQFTGTTNVFVADRMAKDGLTLPPQENELGPLAAMADFAVSAGKSYAAYSLFEVCKALAEYRQGHLGAAAEWAGKASANPFPYSQAEAYSILAMAHSKLGQAEDAHACLVQAEKLARESMPQLDSGDLGGDWRDWVVAHALLREATELMNNSGLPDQQSASK